MYYKIVLFKKRVKIKLCLVFILGFIIEGSYIEVNIVISDVWCLNGVLYIIDNILYIFIRNIMDEMVCYGDIR